MTIRHTILSALFCGAMLLPGAAQAFEVLDTHAYQVTPDTTLFAIEYEFGYLNAEAWLPIAAQSTPIDDTSTPHVVFSLEDAFGEAVTGGTMAAIVLSDAEIRDSYYHIEEGKRETFTLLVLHRTNQWDASAPVVLSVSSLGNVVNTGDDQKYLEASAEQLADYRASFPSISVQK